jgi:hypothetical protein
MFWYHSRAHTPLSPEATRVIFLSYDTHTEMKVTKNVRHQILMHYFSLYRSPQFSVILGIQLGERFIATTMSVNKT